jgi:catechol 2,3-dioxygenase-like lactoylglutathione lyase family enzyme
MPNTKHEQADNLRGCAMTLLLTLFWCVLLSARGAEPLVKGVDSVGITVSDLDRAREFYSKVLNFTPQYEREVSGSEHEKLFGVFGLRLRVARMRLGDEYIELMQFMTPRGRPIPVDSRSNDRWFQHIAVVVSDMSKAYTHLRAHRVAHASSGPQRLPDWNPNAAGIEAFYFRDPDDNHLEVIYFPPNKRAAKWRRDTTRLFLGIDHTAIVIADTDTSLRHYRDLLGLTVAGASENYGTEQEHLNNVFGARLRITALRASHGPGVELLEYLAPRGGRPIPGDTQPTDRWYWQINFHATAGDTGIERLRAAKVSALSYAPVDMTDTSLGFRKGWITRDPDGHAALVASDTSTQSAMTSETGQRP